MYVCIARDIKKSRYFFISMQYIAKIYQSYIDLLYNTLRFSIHRLIFVAKMVVKITECNSFRCVELLGYCPQPISLYNISRNPNTHRNVSMLFDLSKDKAMPLAWKNNQMFLSEMH